MLGERRLIADITEEWLITGDRMFSDQSLKAEIWRSLPLLTLYVLFYVTGSKLFR